MVGKKRAPPPLKKAKQDGEIEDDVLFNLSPSKKNQNCHFKTEESGQKRRLNTCSDLTRGGAKFWHEYSETVMRHRKTSAYALNEAVERCIMEFLLVIPGRLHVVCLHRRVQYEAVCKRWRRLSLEEVPVTVLDFEQVAVRPLLRRDVRTMLERAKQQLTLLVLPDITLVDAHIKLIKTPCRPGTQDAEKSYIPRLKTLRQLTDRSIKNLKALCPRLHLVRVDSCRSVSRKVRRKHNERALRILIGGMLSKCERIFAARKTSKMVAESKSDSESDNESESNGGSDDDYAIK